MSIKRTVVRIVLAACGVAAILSMLAAFHFKGADAVETWLVMAAALAVVTSVLSTWSAQITVEMQEDQLKPNVIVYLDVKDRYQLMQLRMRNIGRSDAFNILDHWGSTIRNAKGEDLQFANDRTGVTELSPEQTLSKAIDTPSEFYKRYVDEKYVVNVEFNDSAGRSYRQKFTIDPSQYAETLMYDREELRTHFEVQQIPKKLDELKAELKKITAIMRHPGDKRDGDI